MSENSGLQLKAWVRIPHLTHFLTTFCPKNWYVMKKDKKLTDHDRTQTCNPHIRSLVPYPLGHMVIWYNNRLNFEAFEQDFNPHFHQKVILSWQAKIQNSDGHTCFNFCNLSCQGSGWPSGLRRQTQGLAFFLDKEWVRILVFNWKCGFESNTWHIFWQLFVPKFDMSWKRTKN